jgi:alcohol dehydrogenase (NADP+)
MLVDILYAGVCHSDLHSAQGPLDYTLVPGHEIVGRVARVGASVGCFKVGDAVGIGPVLDSCRRCDNCKHGLQQYCTNPAFTFTAGKGPAGGEARYGGYANNIVVSQDYAIRIPERMNLAAAAPLLCAGITCWSPIKARKAGRGNKVGVIGMGGLGHLGVKFLADASADVTVFTTTPAKQADAKRFGATEVVAIGDKAAFARLANRFDLLLSTMPVAWEMGAFVNLLALDGTLVDMATLRV